MLLNDKICVHDLAINALEYRNGFDIIGYHRIFVVVHSRSMFSEYRP